MERRQRQRQRIVSLIRTELLQRNEPNYNHIREWVTSSDTATLVLNEPNNNDGNYILHYLCMNNNCPIDLIQYCIEQQQLQQEQEQQQEANATIPASKRPNFLGMFPLHLACKNNHSEQVIQVIYSNYPTAITIPCADGMYPLHYICQYSSSVSGIQLVLSMYPKALTKQCTNERYNPLHWLCVNNRISLESVLTEQLLLSSSISSNQGSTTSKIDIMTAAQQQQSGGCTALHMICKNTESSLVAIEYIYEQNSNALKTPDNNGYLPLHTALENKRPLDVIDYLLETYKKQRNFFRDVWHYTKDRWLPIHIACANHDSLLVIKRLVEEIPPHVISYAPLEGIEAALSPLELAIENEYSSDEIIHYLQQQDITKKNEQFGKEYPLHDACQYQELEAVQAVFHQQEHTIQQKCRKGYYPLHYACSRSPYEAVIQFICNAYPIALEEQCSEGGDTPLHNLFMKKGLSIELLTRSFSLHESFRNALLKQNDMGSTPLHVACQYNLSYEWIQYIIEQGKQAIELPDFFDRLPLHITCENYNQSDDVIELLVDQYPYATRIPSDEGRLPLHIACTSGQSLRVIQLLVTKFPGALLLQLNKPDPVDRKNPFQLAIEAHATNDTLSFLKTETSRMRYQLFEQILKNFLVQEVVES